MITAQQIIDWRNIFGFSQEHVARYLEWNVGTVIGYESGIPLSTAHARQLAKVMGIEPEAVDQPQYRSLERYYDSNGSAYLDDTELAEEYRKIGTNSGQGDFTREICMSRYYSLRGNPKRKSKEM